MPLPTSGPLSLLDIQGEFGGSAPTSLSEYYGVASGIPASGQISINDFYGASAEVSWINLLGGTDQEIGYGVAVDSSNNVIVAGYTKSDGAGGEDVLIAKYGANGSLLWDRTLGGSSQERARAVAVDSADNIIVAGYTASDGAGSFDFLIAKYNSSGTLQWDKTLGGSAIDYGYAVAVDSSDNIIVCGSTQSDGSGSDDVLLAKYNSSGTLQWAKTCGRSVRDEGYAVAVDSADNIVFCGRTRPSDYDLLIGKFNTSGVKQWTRTLRGSANDYGYAIAVDSADNIIVGGYTRSAGAGATDALMAKYNSSGTIQWQRTLGAAFGNDTVYGVAVDSSDNIIVSGVVQSSSVTQGCLIAKCNSSGVLQWARILDGGSAFDFGYAVAVNSADNIIFTGYTGNDGAGSNELIVAKVPGDGTGTGTYGSFTYQSVSLSDAAASLTSSSSSHGSSNAVLTDANAVLTDDPAVLTETFYSIS